MTILLNPQIQKKSPLRHRSLLENLIAGNIDIIRTAKILITKRLNQ